MARQMIAEKDEQITVLQAKIEDLKNEIASGLLC
jgi:anti-sigma28 factor (negative regulator of flagellin synthesis)